MTAYSIMGLTADPGNIVGGTVTFNGHEIEKLTEKDLRKIRGKEVSIIFQDPMTSLNPVYTIGSQIEEVILLHTDKTKTEARERATELLRLVGINEPEKRIRQYPHELSGGMRQRVMIAIALACEPKLLIADEPTTAPDVTIQAQILDLINELRNKLNMAVILITHDLGIRLAHAGDMRPGGILRFGETLLHFDGRDGVRIIAISASCCFPYDPFVEPSVYIDVFHREKVGSERKYIEKIFFSSRFSLPSMRRRVRHCFPRAGGAKEYPKSARPKRRITF